MVETSASNSERQNPILIIEDHRDLRDTLCSYLRKAGFQVLEAANGNQALDLFETKRPALVITDLLMPEKEGISTIRDIRKTFAQTKIIAMSGGGLFGSHDLLRSAKSLGADAALAKPFDFDELQRVIDMLLYAQTQ